MDVKIIGYFVIEENEDIMWMSEATGGYYVSVRCHSDHK